LDELENLYGRLAVARLASFLTCSEFGLSETELLELLMPTSNSTATLTLTTGNYNFSTLCAVRRRMSESTCSRPSLPSLSRVSSLRFSLLLSHFYLWARFVHLFICVCVFHCLFVSFPYAPYSILSSICKNTSQYECVTSMKDEHLNEISFLKPTKP